MDPYNVTKRRYQDNSGRDMNCIGMHMHLMMLQMDVNRPPGYPLPYMYILTQDELWADRHGAVDGSGGGDGNEELLSLVFILSLCGFKTILFLCLVMQDLK